MTVTSFGCRQRPADYPLPSRAATIDGWWGGTVDIGEGDLEAGVEAIAVAEPVAVGIDDDRVIVVRWGGPTR